MIKIYTKYFLLFITCFCVSNSSFAQKKIFQKIEKYKLNSDNEKLLKTINKGLKKHPKIGRLFVEKALYLEKNKKPKAAISFFKIAIQTEPTSEIYLKFGNFYYRQSNYYNAEIMYDQAVSKSIKSIEAHLGLARTNVKLMYLNKLDESIVKIESLFKNKLNQKQESDLNNLRQEYKKLKKIRTDESIKRKEYEAELVNDFSPPCVKKSDTYFAFMDNNEWYFFNLETNNQYRSFSYVIDETPEFSIAKSYYFMNFRFKRRNDINKTIGPYKYKSNKLSLKINNHTFDFEIKDCDIFYKKNRIIRIQTNRPNSCIFGDCINGRGVLISENSLYEGTFLDGNKSGIGEIVLNDGTFYSGCWENNQFHSYGSFVVPDKARYSGIWDNGDFKGKGSTWNKNGIFAALGEALSATNKLTNSLDIFFKKQNRSKEQVNPEYKYELGGWSNSLMGDKNEAVTITCLNGSNYTTYIYESNYSKKPYSVQGLSFTTFNSYDEALTNCKKLLVQNYCYAN